MDAVEDPPDARTDGFSRFAGFLRLRGLNLERKGGQFVRQRGERFVKVVRQFLRAFRLRRMGGRGVFGAASASRTAFVNAAASYLNPSIVTGKGTPEETILSASVKNERFDRTISFSSPDTRKRRVRSTRAPNCMSKRSSRSDPSNSLQCSR